MGRTRLACSLLLAVMSIHGTAAAAEVIAHPAYPEAGIARPLLRGVFGMRVRAWPDGTPVRVFVLDDDHPVHQEFAKTILQMYPYQLRQNWDRLLYSGTGQQPITVGSQEELLRRVAATPGAIGYVDQYAPPAPPPPPVKRGKGAPAPPAPPARPLVKVLRVD